MITNKKILDIIQHAEVCNRDKYWELRNQVNMLQMQVNGLSKVVYESHCVQDKCIDNGRLIVPGECIIKLPHSVNIKGVVKENSTTINIITKSMGGEDTNNKIVLNNDKIANKVFDELVEFYKNDLR